MAGCGLRLVAGIDSAYGLGTTGDAGAGDIFQSQRDIKGGSQSCGSGGIQRDERTLQFVGL